MTVLCVSDASYFHILHPLVLVVPYENLLAILSPSRRRSFRAKCHPTCLSGWPHLLALVARVYLLVLFYIYYGLYT